MAETEKPKRGTEESRKRQGKARLRFEQERPVGRPRTTVDDLPQGWQDIMKQAAQGGGSTVTIMVLLGIGHTAFETLLQDSEVFRRTVEACRLLAQNWHETVGRNMMVGANGNAVAWKFAMQNQFGWKDKNQVSGDPEAPLQQNVTVTKRNLSAEELKAELEARGLPTDIFEE